MVKYLCYRTHYVNFLKYEHFFISGANNVVEHYGQIKKILYMSPFEGWPNRAWPSKPFLPNRVGRQCPARSARKRTPVQDLTSFYIMFYYIISTTYQKIGELYCPVHISGLSHGVKRNLDDLCVKEGPPNKPRVDFKKAPWCIAMSVTH